MHLVTLLLQSPVDSEQARHIAMAVLAIFPIIMLVFLVIFIVPFWFICKKAGFSPWLALVNLLPMGTLILLYILAFAEWKVVPAPQAAYQPFPYPPQPPVPPIAPPLA